MEIFQSLSTLDYKHYWTVEDLERVARCDADRKEVLYALSALYLTDQNPEYEVILEFLRLENKVAVAILDYYRDMISYRYTPHENSVFSQKLKQAFSDIRSYEGRLEEFGWTKVYSKWGQRK